MLKLHPLYYDFVYIQTDKDQVCPALTWWAAEPRIFLRFSSQSALELQDNSRF